MPGATPPEPEYVSARKILLDGLAALEAHLDAIVLVGAQAIYLRVGESDLAVAPYTTDADLAINPGRLGDRPILSEALESAGFGLFVRPGTWKLAETDVQIDFLVPASLGGSGRRGARLGIHGTDVARKATGLEAALVDRSPIRVEALEPTDSRSFEVQVAGVAALLVAKLHKIGERRETPDRLRDKDALDVLRLLRHCDPARHGATLNGLASNPVAGQTTRAARIFLAELFGGRDAVGSQMAVRSTAGLEDEMTIAASCEELTRRLLRHWT